VALIKSDLVGIREFENLSVRGPVLDLGILGSSTLELILSHEVFVIKGIEVSTLTLVWELWSIAYHISVGVVPSVIVVSVESFLVINCMNKDIVLTSVFLKFRKTFDML
jgi:hypothetical protein